MNCNEQDVLKGGILLEMRGRILYETAARSASEEPVRNLFLALAEEEGRHQAWLERLFVDSAVEGSTSGFEMPDSRGAHAVLTPEVVGAISAAGFESAVISAAIGLEEKAIEFYERGAALLSDRECGRILLSLADWERTHLELLTGLDRQIREKAWFDAGFWPSI
jgi:rubrerythrin